MSWRRIRVVIRRHTYVLWRAPHRWFDIAFWPLMDVILWGSLGTYIAQQDAGSRAGTPYLISGIVMFHVLFQSQIAVATGFMEETWSRNLLNVLTTPVTEFEYVAGTAVFGMAKVLLALTTVSVTAFIAFGFSLDEIGWSMVPIAAILVIVGWGVGVANIGVVLRFGQGAEILTWGTNFILMALSGVFNPVEALPGALQPVARVLPSTHAFNALRTVMGGDPLPVDEIVIGLVGGAGFVVGGFAFSWWMLRIFRRRGFVTRFS
ncbi:MAG: ABC transporter permease [Actinomycetota bacterium]|jgi:ABC-2 type transport system permease protein|nr:MAG: multidrug ABC transporter permease [Acidimicrobiaceae bacterium]